MDDRARSSTADPVRVGGRYVLGPELGRGGMARVHRAHDEVLGRDVAVKVLHPHLAEDPAFLARFRREAQAAAALSHPNVVAVHDWGESEDGAYLVLQLVDGVSLRDVLQRRGRLEPAEALAILAPAAQGLGAAHRAGLVHRDVKPENLLIGRDGVVRVTDFGLARAAASATSTFGADVLVGSPHYLSPEAVQGEALDPRADVYALGIVLVECLTGAPPHDAESPFATAMQHTLHPVPAPSDVRPELGDLLDGVVLTATDMDREHRYDDAGAFAQALGRMLGGAVPRVAPPGPSEASAEDERAGPSDPDALEARQATTRLPRIDRDAQTQLVAPDTAVTRVPDEVSSRAAAGHDTTSGGAASALGPPPPGPPPISAPGAAGSRPLEPSHAPTADEDVDDDLDDLDDDGDTPRPRRGRGWLVLLLVLGLLAGSAAGGYLLWDRVLAPVTPIPDVLGSPVDAADDQLREAGFEVRIDDTRPHDLDVPEGHVLAQSPNGELRQGGTIELVLSAGPRPVTIPDLAGTTQEDAAAELTAEGIEVELSERFDERVEAGIVLETVPAADTVLDEGSVVEVVVSAGPAPIDVPDLVGSAEGAAGELLEELGLELVVVDRRFASVPAGEVLEQSPASGETRVAGDEVEVVVSEGPEPVEVPSVRGERVGDAVAALEALGFEVEVDRRGGFGALLNPDRVYDQDPAPGTRRPVGDTIVVYAYN